MTISTKAEPVPLDIDADGIVRVGGTRVTLDTIVTAFLEGATAEEIAHQYPSLDLADDDIAAKLKEEMRRSG